MGVLPEKVVKKCLWATGREDPDYVSNDNINKKIYFQKKGTITCTGIVGRK